MSDTKVDDAARTIDRDALPSRLHHNAFVTRDQEATRHFYEDLIGLPLIATWTEADELFGALRVYCHTFFGLGDGGALAFFQFEKPEDADLFGPEMPDTPFHHIALKVSKEVQDAIEARVKAANWRPEETYVLEHGYCRSLYIPDPNGLLLEFTLDASNVEEITATRLASAHADLTRWLGGDHSSNNDYR